MMKGRILCIAFFLILCLPVFVGCNTISTSEVSTDPTDVPTSLPAEVPIDVSINGYAWVVENGAKLDGEVLRCPAGSKAVCSDSAIPNTYILECDITATSGGDNGIAINNTANDFYYILEINSKNDKVILKKYFGNKSVTVADADFLCEAGTLYHLKLAVYSSSIKVFLTESGESDATYQIMDVIIDKIRPNFISFIGASDELTVENIMIKKNDMILEADERYINPIASGADPYVLFHDGVYYLYSTNAVNLGYRVFTSTDLKTWEDRGLCLKTADVYGTPTQTAGFWAPEVYNYNGKFYMIYTVEEHLGIAVADSPLGPFVSPKQRFISDKRGNRRSPLL